MGSSNPMHLLELQRTVGNNAVVQLLARKVDGDVTGIPAGLKSGIEELSGLPGDDVRVHYNSEKPAQLNALAYAQGPDVFIAPGQEKHLPHEAWHVVQQREKRVVPRLQI
jgi:hypothetical protein